VPFGRRKKKFTSSTATNLCSNSSTTLCGVHFAEISSNMQQACSALTASLPATRSVIQRWLPSASRNQTPRQIRMKVKSTIGFPIGGKASPTWVPTGAVIVVTCCPLGGSNAENALVSFECQHRDTYMLTCDEQNARSRAILNAPILCLIFAACPWRRPILF
jgi:hypothetical protein